MRKCRIDLFVLPFAVLIGTSTASADAVFLKDHKDAVHGQIVDETEDAFVIEVPKASITKIEREAPFVRRSVAATPAIERQAAVASSSSTSAQAGTLSSPTEGSLPPVADIPVTPSSAIDRRLGGIVGRVLWDTKPLVNCKVKAVMVSSAHPLAAMAKLLGRPEEAYAEEGYVAEITTDTAGRYHFDGVPPGEYDLYWQPVGSPSAQWIRRLREKPDLVVLEGAVATHPDIEAHVKTRN